MYDLTNLSNSISISDIAQYTNNVTDGLFFTLGIVSVFIIMLFIMKKFSFELAIITTSFTCFILSVMGWAGGFIGSYVVIAFTVIFTSVMLFAMMRSDI